MPVELFEVLASLLKRLWDLYVLYIFVVILNSVTLPIDYVITYVLLIMCPAVPVSAFIHYWNNLFIEFVKQETDIN